MLLTSAPTNLLQNAVKFTPPGRRVAVRGHQVDGGPVRIEIEDEFGGLEPTAKEIIFAPFVQAGKDRSGLGLGLGIAREIVAAHHGTLGVRNLPGCGCIFVMELPPPALAALKQPALNQPAP